MSAFYGNCPTCNNSWPGCSCQLIACAQCKNPQIQCVCAYTAGQHTQGGFVGGTPFGVSPFVGTTVGGITTTGTNYTWITCPVCGGTPLQCSCKNQWATNVPNTWITSSTSTFMGPWTMESFFDINIHDIHDDKLIINAPTHLSLVDKADTGFKGQLSFLALPLFFDNYFVNVGKAWQILSPLIFKVSHVVKDENVSHLITVMDFKNITTDTDKSMVTIHDLEINEIKDNFTFIKLASIDKEFRKKILA